MVQADYDNDGDLSTCSCLRGAWLGGRWATSEFAAPRTTVDGTFRDVTFESGARATSHYPTQTAAWGGLRQRRRSGPLHRQRNVSDASPSRPASSFETTVSGASFVDVAAAAAGIAYRGFREGRGVGRLRRRSALPGPLSYRSTPSAEPACIATRAMARSARWAPELGVRGSGQELPGLVLGLRQRRQRWISSPPSYSEAAVNDVAAVAASYRRATGAATSHPRLYRGDGRGGFQEVARRSAACRFRWPCPWEPTSAISNNDGYLGLLPRERVIRTTPGPDAQHDVPGTDAASASSTSPSPAASGTCRRATRSRSPTWTSDGDLDVLRTDGRQPTPATRSANVLYENPGFGENRSLTDPAGRRHARTVAPSEPASMRRVSFRTARRASDLPARHERRQLRRQPPPTDRRSRPSRADRRARRALAHDGSRGALRGGPARCRHPHRRRPRRHRDPRPEALQLAKVDVFTDEGLVGHRWPRTPR